MSSRRGRRNVFGDDDLVLPNAHARALLESGMPLDEEVVGGRHQRRLERHSTGADELFGLDDLERADSVAAKIPNADGLAQKVALRTDQWSDLRSIAPFTRINPPSSLQGVLGGQQQVSAGQAIQTVNWAGVDAETVPVTITLAPVQQFIPGTAKTNQQFRPFAIIQFGTRGFSVKFEVDIGKGTQFTVGASAVAVQLAMEEDNAGATMLLAGMLSFYPIVRTTPVTRTLYSPVLNMVAATTFTVPAFAKNLTVWRGTVGAAFTIDFLNATGGIVYQVTVAGGVFMFDPIPLSGDIISVRITPGAGLGRVVLIFELSF